MSDTGALISSGLYRRRSAGIYALEDARRGGALVAPGVRQAWRDTELTGRVPAHLPRPKRLPSVLRLADPTSPTGVRTIRPIAGQVKIIQTARGPLALTPEKILDQYLYERRRLPLYQRQLGENRGRLARTAYALERIKREYEGRQMPAGLGKKYRRLLAELATKQETHQELEEAMGEATRIITEREKQASAEEGVGFLFLVWPIAVAISAIALGGYGITSELQSTKRLEIEAEAAAKGQPLQQAGIGGLVGRVTAALGTLQGVLLIGGAIYLYSQTRSGRSRRPARSAA